MQGGPKSEAASRAAAAAPSPAVKQHLLSDVDSSSSSGAQCQPLYSSAKTVVPAPPTLSHKESEYESAEEPVEDNATFLSCTAASDAYTLNATLEETVVNSEPATSTLDTTSTAFEPVVVDLLTPTDLIVESETFASKPIVATHPLPAASGEPESSALGVFTSSTAYESTTGISSEISTNEPVAIQKFNSVTGQSETSTCEDSEYSEGSGRTVANVPSNNTTQRYGLVSGSFSESQDDSEFELYEQALLNQVCQNEDCDQQFRQSAPDQDIAAIQELALTQELALSQDIASSQELSLFQDSLPDQTTFADTHSSAEFKNDITPTVSGNKTVIIDNPTGVNSSNNFQLSSDLDKLLLLKCTDDSDPAVVEAFRSSSLSHLLPTSQKVSSSHALEAESCDLKSPLEKFLHESVNTNDVPNPEIAVSETNLLAQEGSNSFDACEGATCTPVDAVTLQENNLNLTTGTIGPLSVTLTDSAETPESTPVAATDTLISSAGIHVAQEQALAFSADTSGALDTCVASDTCVTPTDIGVAPADTLVRLDEEVPIVPKATYNLDFLNHLDDPNFNPFGTQTSIRNSPPPSPPPGVKLPPLKPAIKKKKNTGSKPSSSLSPSSSKLEESSGPEEKRNSSTVSQDTGKGIDRDAVTEDSVDKSVLVKDSVSTSQENNNPPVSETPKRVAKKPFLKSRQKPSVSCKSSVTKAKTSSRAPCSAPAATHAPHKLGEGTEDGGAVPLPQANTEEEIIVPSKGYNLDFLDNLDDPNFNPFASRSSFGVASSSSSSKLNNTGQVVEKNNNFIESKNDSNSHGVSFEALKSTNFITNNEDEEIECKEVSLTTENSICSFKTETPSEPQSTTLVPKEDPVPSEHLFSASKPEELNSEPKPLGNTDFPGAVAAPLKKSACDLNRVPSFGGISVSLLESQEFDQLLGNEASRLAEELSTLSLEASFSSDEAAVFSTGEVFLDCVKDSSDMATSRYGRAPPARRSLNLEGGNEAAFKAGVQLSRSPPSSGQRRPVSVGAAADPFVPSRTLRRDDDDVGPLSSLDSGLSTSMQVSGGEDSRAVGEMDNHSEAGPDIATGMTPSDLQAASQFFKDAKELEHQLKRTFGPGILGESPPAAPDAVARIVRYQPSTLTKLELIVDFAANIIMAAKKESKSSKLFMHIRKLWKSSASSSGDVAVTPVVTSNTLEHMNVHNLHPWQPEPLITETKKLLENVHEFKPAKPRQFFRRLSSRYKKKKKKDTPSTTQCSTQTTPLGSILNVGGVSRSTPGSVSDLVRLHTNDHSSDLAQEPPLLEASVQNVHFPLVQSQLNGQSVCCILEEHLRDRARIPVTKSPSNISSYKSCAPSNSSEMNNLSNHKLLAAVPDGDISYCSSSDVIKSCTYQAVVTASLSAAPVAHENSHNLLCPNSWLKAHQHLAVSVEPALEHESRLSSESPPISKRTPPIASQAFESALLFSNQSTNASVESNSLLGNGRLKIQNNCTNTCSSYVTSDKSIVHAEFANSLKLSSVSRVPVARKRTFIITSPYCIYTLQKKSKCEIPTYNLKEINNNVKIRSSKSSIPELKSSSCTERNTVTEVVNSSTSYALPVKEGCAEAPRSSQLEWRKKYFALQSARLRPTQPTLIRTNPRARCRAPAGIGRDTVQKCSFPGASYQGVHKSLHENVDTKPRTFENRDCVAQLDESELNGCKRYRTNECTNALNNYSHDSANLNFQANSNPCNAVRSVVAKCHSEASTDNILRTSACGLNSSRSGRGAVEQSLFMSSVDHAITRCTFSMLYDSPTVTILSETCTHCINMMKLSKDNTYSRSCILRAADGQSIKCYPKGDDNRKVNSSSSFLLKSKVQPNFRATCPIEGKNIRSSIGNCSDQDTLKHHDGDSPTNLSADVSVSNGTNDGVVSPSLGSCKCLPNDWSNGELQEGCQGHGVDRSLKCPCNSSAIVTEVASAVGVVRSAVLGRVSECEALLPPNTDSNSSSCVASEAILCKVGLDKKSAHHRYITDATVNEATQCNSRNCKRSDIGNGKAVFVKNEKVKLELPSPSRTSNFPDVPFTFCESDDVNVGDMIRFVSGSLTREECLNLNNCSNSASLSESGEFYLNGDLARPDLVESDKIATVCNSNHSNAVSNLSEWADRASVSGLSVHEAAKAVENCIIMNKNYNNQYFADKQQLCEGDSSETSSVVSVDELKMSCVSESESSSTGCESTVSNTHASTPASNHAQSSSDDAQENGAEKVELCETEELGRVIDSEVNSQRSKINECSLKLLEKSNAGTLGAENAKNISDDEGAFDLSDDIIDLSEEVSILADNVFDDPKNPIIENNFDLGILDPRVMNSSDGTNLNLDDSEFFNDENSEKMNKMNSGSSDQESSSERLELCEEFLVKTG
ncbi:hypothetical protein FHG87_002883 [Trinorchestia longiramus]|nr:hypothetical protein FHG87_002883 [Trinorchestia longiramus]